MQQTGQAAGWNGTGRAALGLAETQAAEGGRERVEAVVETLAHLHGGGESLAAVAHDARNMVTALGLYCDLLEEPGVLTPSFHHYASELRLVATASRRLVEKLLALDLRLESPANHSLPAGAGLATAATAARGAGRQEDARDWDLMPTRLIDNLAGEVLASRDLLAALAGPSIALTVDAEGGAQPVRLTGEELTRILVNLVKNAAEAMPGGGRIQIGLRERPATDGASPEGRKAGVPMDGSSPEGWKAGVPMDRSSSMGWKAGVPGSLTLTVEDNGPGIPGDAIEKIFESGYSASATNGGSPASHRGLGLAITRSIVEAAGGHVHVANREPAGARFEIELPIRSR
jgi:signal transduction histidine kinase